ncbi:hypothetical protein AbraIFM66950_009632 [Aspergillus brasiliensis]|nr:hypothetical protein AbraIFM66950_009632 [Aspergillus brasiliensis]
MLSIYSTLRLGPNTTRLVRLLPPEKDEHNAEIKCELFNYVLAERSPRRHLYEALSYVWGSESKPYTILLNGTAFPVTHNLYTALLYLRDSQLERTLWIDAICINQDDNDEKATQIPLMRAIYAQAGRVVVWLGETGEDGDEALKEIHYQADKGVPTKISSVESQDMCKSAWFKLLQREWFKRVWVLQEVGVARCISVVCGPVELNGHAFCEGISNLKYCPPVLRLFRGALLRPSYEISSRGELAIGELLDMYRNHKSTKPHDKVYGLLGLSCEDPERIGLTPNYHLPWHEVFKKVAMHVFRSSCSIETWPGEQVAVIKGMTYVLGYVEFVEEGTSKYGHQQFSVIYTSEVGGLYKRMCGTTWRLQSPAEPIRKGDIICLLHQRRRPIIVRPHRSNFSVVVNTIAPTMGYSGLDNIYDNAARGLIQPSLQAFPKHIHIIWEIPLDNQESCNTLRDQESFSSEVLPYHEGASKTNTSSIIDELIVQMLKQAHTRESILYLLQHRPKDPAVSEDVLIAAAAYQELGNSEIMERLLELNEKSLSDRVFETAASNEGPNGPKVMQQLLKHHESGLLIPEKVVRAAAGNPGQGWLIMEQLLAHYGTNLPVSERVVEVAAGNLSHGRRIMERLLAYHEGNLPVSERVVEAAAGNTRQGVHIMERLLAYHGRNLPVSERVAEAANTTEEVHIRRQPRAQYVTVLSNPTSDEVEELVQTAADNIVQAWHRATPGSIWNKPPSFQNS